MVAEVEASLALVVAVEADEAAEVAEAIQLAEQRAAAADVSAPTGNQLGTQYLPNQAQLQRPGEQNIQGQRMATGAGRESVYPQGLGGLDILGSQLGTATGLGRDMPSGQRVG